ncbi:MAG: PhoU domain-containing protein [Candidatus Sulfotelmatobacter sp.]|jgi:phosphate transport system protein
MPRKSASALPSQQKLVEEASVTAVAEPPPGAAKKAQKKGAASLDDLARTALKAFLIARDAASNVGDLFTPTARMAFLAIKECEQELDVIERYIDERTPAAITRVNEIRARQLLTSLKCTTDLERIGDLVMSMALRVQARTSKVPASDVRQLVEMASILREMLDLVYRGFTHLDLECARKVLQMDKDIDRVCHALFQKHLTEHAAQSGPSSFEILLMAQALERAGDHTTNLAEDLYSLIEGRSLRHAPKKRAAT